MPPSSAPPSTSANASSTSSSPTNSPEPLRWHWPSALAGILLSAIVLGAISFWWRKPTPPPLAIHPPPSPVVPTPIATPTPAPLVIFISGAVQVPGVYALPAGARVVDALEQAGGFTADANVDSTNQAAPLRDGDQIYVPTLVEEAESPPTGVSNDSRAIEIDVGAAGEPANGVINVNSATLEELVTLPGIGDTRAQAIIDNRPYASVDELERVPGIGPATLEKLRPYVVAE